MAHWGDVTEKARELAKREREIYQQQTIPAVLEEMAAEIERLRGELADLIHDHSRAQSALSEFATENERLRAQLNKEQTK